MENYQYKPIKWPSSLRMVQVLPGEQDSPVTLKLCHRPLSFLPRCEALAYEWQPTSRKIEVSCDGKILKISPNLLSALKDLRLATSSSNGSILGRQRFLWIDEICINHDDPIERLQQLQLLQNVYQNASKIVVQLQGRRALSAEAFSLLPRLAEIYALLPSNRKSSDSFESESDLGDTEISIRTLQVNNDSSLEQLPQTRLWPALVELLGPTPVHSQLIMALQIALASKTKTVVMCGSLSHSWETFRQASAIFRNCSFLRASPTSTHNDSLFDNSRHWTLVMDGQNIYQHILMTMLHDVADPRDRVFALLGFLNSNLRSKLTHLDHTCTPGEAFMAATKCVLSQANTLDFLRHKNSVCAGKNEPRVPTWVLWLDSSSIKYSNSLPPALSISKAQFSRFTVETKGRTLITRGFIFDTVSHAYSNFSSRNIHSIVRQAYMKCIEDGASFDKSKRAIDLLLKSLLQSDSEVNGPKTDLSSLRADFMSYIGDLVSGAASRSSSRRRAGSSWRAPPQSGRWRRRNMGGDSAKAKTLMQHNLLSCDATDQQGRNLFSSQKGYQGVGPFDNNKDDKKRSAVKVGDHIVFIPTVGHPLILRPRPNDTYKFIGPAFIPSVEDAPCFTEGRVIEVDRILIR
ncbi:hypothetical protein B0J14DRAFT_491853 [Halenospora varia]|nr:hypothetical protein B0J14DRAFT_491853 [Halenospora varia]